MTASFPNRSSTALPGLIHGQCDPSTRYGIADENPYVHNAAFPCRVWLYARAAGTEIPIAAAMPPQPPPARDHRGYHIDPHPHFAAGGELAVYTTTARGRVDVAVTPVREALARLASHGRPPGGWALPGGTWTGWRQASSSDGSR